MSIDKYTKFLMTSIVIWLFGFAFFHYYTNTQMLELEKWKAGYLPPFAIRKVVRPISKYKITQHKGYLIRLNEHTGVTEYWSVESGGWVEIQDTDLVTIVNREERQKRKGIMDGWYLSLSDEMKEKFNRDQFEFNMQTVKRLSAEGTPSWQLREAHDTYKENPQEWERKFIEEWNKFWEIPQKR